MLPTARLSIFTLESCRFLPINKNSVLSSLSLSLSVGIHVRMSFLAFHGNDRISLISTKRQVKPIVISIGMCFK